MTWIHLTEAAESLRFSHRHGVPPVTVRSARASVEAVCIVECLHIVVEQVHVEVSGEAVEHQSPY